VTCKLTPNVKERFALRRRTRDLRRRTGEEGFTLIEVMISILLLVMISIAIYQATTQTFKYRAKIINEGDFYGGIRLAMGLMDRDVALLFSPVNLNPKNFKTTTTGTGTDPNAASGFTASGFPTARKSTGAASGASAAQAAQDATQLEELTRSDLGQVSDYWLPATDLSAIRPSRFFGTENSIRFVSASHQRVYKDTPDSEFAKIVYELQSEKTPEIEGTKILVRTEDPNVFDDVSKKSPNLKSYPLLPGVKSFSFRYYRKDKKAWEHTWDSNRDDMKGLYPDLIECTIEVAGFNRAPFKGVYMMKPETLFYGLDPTL
jgi:prepilin-type N-terminal cleavage/methylation domain-containing protein